MWLPKFLRNPKYNLPQSVTRRELIQKESEVGARIFGYLPPNRRREFFMLDQHTWVWYEEWQDGAGLHKVTTRYEIHGTSVLKLQNERSAELVTGDELRNLYQAIRTYYYNVAGEVYHRPIPA